MKEKKSPGWSKIGIAIGEMAASVPQMGGKYPALYISSEAEEIEEETEKMEIEAVDSMELKDSHSLNEYAAAEGETETDSFPSVISASIYSGEDKSFKVIKALCSDSPGHGGWPTQEASVGTERGEKVGKLVALEEERLASYETEVARLDSGSISGRRASFNLDVSTFELERVSLPPDTEEMVASMGEPSYQISPLTMSTKRKKNRRVSISKDQLPTVDQAPLSTSLYARPTPPPKISSTRPMKVSFSLVGRIHHSIAQPRRDKVVSYIQLGRLAPQPTFTASLPSLRDILAKTSSCASDLGDPDITPLPKQSVAQWLRNLHTPDSLESGGTPVLARRERRQESREVQTSQSMEGKQEDQLKIDIAEGLKNALQPVDMDAVEDQQENVEIVTFHQQIDCAENSSCESSPSDVQAVGQVKTIEHKKPKSGVSTQAESQQLIPSIQHSTSHPLPSSPPPTLSTLLQSHLANISPAPPLSVRPNARLGRKKAKAGTVDPYQDPKPGTSGTQKKQTRAQARNSKEKEDRTTRSKRDGQKDTNEKSEYSQNNPLVEKGVGQTNVIEKIFDVDKNDVNDINIDIASQVESSCPLSGNPWVINLVDEDSCELPIIDKYAGEDHQPFMADILGKEVGLYSQDKETREEELDRVATLQFEEENRRGEDSPVRKRGRIDDSDDDSPAKMVKKKARRLESDDEDASQELKMIPSAKRYSSRSSRSSVKRTPGGTDFQNTFQPEEKLKESENTGSQVIELVDSQEEMVTTQNGYTDQDMELPVVDQPVSQVTQSKSLLDTPSIPANCNLSRSSSASSLTSDSELDQKTTQEIQRDLRLAEIRATKLRSDMDINVEVLGSQAFFQEMTNNRQVQDTTLSTIQETDSMGLNVAMEMVETEPIELNMKQTEVENNSVTVDNIPETETLIRETELDVGETENFYGEFETEMDVAEPEKNGVIVATEPIMTDLKTSTVSDSDDDLFSQTQEDPKSKTSAAAGVLSPVVEMAEAETSQVIKSISRSVTVDTSNWKFVTSNLVQSARKLVPQFISSLGCKGLVGKVDDTVTHIIVSTGEELEAQRTLKYLQGVASGVMVVSHLWVEASIRDQSNVARAEKWEVTDEELGGANGPWRARKRKEEGRGALLAGFEVLIEGELDGLDRSSVEDLLDRSGARAVPDKNAFSFTSGVTRLVLVDSTANIGAKVVGKLIRSYMLATVDKDWLLDTLGGHCVRPILHYTLNTVQREELVRAGYTGSLIE